MFFDPAYLFYVMLPGLALGAWASWRVKSAYKRGSQIPGSRGMTGAQAAHYLLEAQGVHDVSIEQTPGHLSDHFDPRNRVLRLSPEVYSGTSVASVGVAAHEAGHAIQQAVSYGPLAIRNALVPTAGFGSNASFIILIAGLILNLTPLVYAGIALFAVVLLFQLVNLPVEFDASARARRGLVSAGIVTPQEETEVGKVLNAAAMTYVAATITSALTLAYYIMRFTRR